MRQFLVDGVDFDEFSVSLNELEKTYDCEKGSEKARELTYLASEQEETSNEK